MAEHPREYLDHLLRALREADMAWIAEEIEVEIAQGRTVEKTIEEGRLKSGLTVEEFTDDEQLAIAMRVVLERVQVGYAVWLETADVLRRRLGVRAVEYVDVQGERSSPFEPFSAGFDRIVDEVASVFGKVASECALLGGDDLHRLSARPSRLAWSAQ